MARAAHPLADRKRLPFMASLMASALLTADVSWTPLLNTCRSATTRADLTHHPEKDILISPR